MGQNVPFFKEVIPLPPSVIPPKLTMWRRLFPFLHWLPQWPKSGHVQSDVWAGLTGATVVLPQGVAFATLAGMPPQYGLYAAMVPCVVAALWGSSRVMVTGPANAISLTTLALVAPLATPGSPDYVALVLSLTFMVGVLQLAIGISGLGRLVEKVPHAVILGFTIGAAVLIANSQVGTALGLSLERTTSILVTAGQVLERLDQINFFPLAIAVMTIVFILLFEKVSRRLPAMFFGLLLASAVTWLLTHWLGRPSLPAVSALPSALPLLSWPIPPLEVLPSLFVPCLVMTMLALAEASAISRAMATRQGIAFNGTQEVIGQGLGNLTGSFFSSYPTSGSFNRSGVNIASGAKTPMAAVIASLLLVLILAFGREFATLLPLACIAGVLWVVAWRLIERRDLRHTLELGWSNRLACLFTMGATLFWSLEAALIGGVLLFFVVQRILGPDQKGPSKS
jgi:SulP family sulfate permease